jgi:type 1 glutamine amidotransferase
VLLATILVAPQPLMSFEDDIDAKTVLIGPDIVEPAILVFSKTLEWRHNSGIAGADLYAIELGQKLKMNVFTTVDSTVFNAEDLKRFKLVIFNNATGDILSAKQQQAFQAWLTAGGGWIGVHGSGDASQAEWDWYQKKLIGPKFISHPMAPQIQKARLQSLSIGHPVLQGIPDEWYHADEWYTFDGTPQDYGLTPLVGLDETTYSPVNTVYGDVSDLRMGEGAINHPIIWSGCVGKGRTVYSGIGHSNESYNHPLPKKILENAAMWVMGKTDIEGTGCNHKPAR